MNISLLTAFPHLYTSFLSTSLVGKAHEKGLVSFDVRSFMEMVKVGERIDAPTCGHGAGMILRPEVVGGLITDQQQKKGPAYTIFFSPQGERLDQRLLKTIYQEIQKQQHSHLMLVAGRYEGFDARVEEVYADRIISIGDYVLMGGDLPIMVFLEGFMRLIPTVVGKAESVEHDSFRGSLLDHDEYCLPVEWQGKVVPEVLRAGNHKAIAQWRMHNAVQKTVDRRFDWIKQTASTADEKKSMLAAIPPHYVVLMHDQVLTGKDKLPGKTSVTSIDIHDIARSACTYGLKNFFIVTSLIDQQKIVAQFLEFWKGGHGITYNPNRHEAMRRIEVAVSLEEVVAQITAIEGMSPVLVVTSAQKTDHPAPVTFHDQRIVWQQKRPVLFLLGTGQGIAPDVVAKADYVLSPVIGLTDYNHLSVRSAAAIIFDRWLGISEDV
jgi:tRNA (guanine37-N1)-methyltransferase